MQTTISEHPPVADLKVRAADAGRKAASGMVTVLQTAAQRMRDRDYRAALADVRKFVDERPGTALLTAAVIGFVLLRSLARR